MDPSLTSGADHLSPKNFHRLAQFIEAYSGIRMPPTKQTMVEGRLRRRAAALGEPSLDKYCIRLFDGDGLTDEVVDLIDAVTTNKTDFFREADHFHQLAEQVLPQLMARPGHPGIDRPLDVWSAACSTGAEPYTLAIVLDAFAQHRRGFRFSILATDICTDVLAKAKLGIYPDDMAEPVPPELRHRYFRRSRDPENATVRVVAEIRRMVNFGRLNLMDADYPVNDMDIIFCRNILIYFEKGKQQAVLERLCRRLRPGGFLFVGHSETVTGMDLPLTQVASALFMKR